MALEAVGDAMDAPPGLALGEQREAVLHKMTNGLGFGRNSPAHEQSSRPSRGWIHAVPEVGGLDHRFQRVG